MPDFLRSSNASIFTLMADGNGPILGASVSVTVTDPDGTVVVNALAATEIGGGEYAYSLSPSNTAKVGTFRAVWLASYSGKQLRSELVFTVGLSSYPSVTVQEIRHMIALTELEGKRFRKGKVTAVGSGTYTVAAWAHRPDDDLVGHNLYVYAGTGEGQEAVILSHVKGASGAVLILSALTTALDTTSLVEVHENYTVEAYNLAIRRAQMEAADRLGVPMNDRTLVAVAGQSAYDIPSGFVCIDSVLVAGSELELDKWDIVPGRRQIKITASMTAGDQIELRGRAKVGDILSDYSVVEVPPTYLVYKAAAMLLRTEAGGPSTDPDASSQRSVVYEQLAASVLVRQPQLIRTNSRVVA